MVCGTPICCTAAINKMCSFYLDNAARELHFRDTKQNSTNLCLIRIHTKYYTVTHCIIDSAAYFSCHILKTKFRLTKIVTIALFGFAAYRFKNRNSSGGPNVST